MDNDIHESVQERRVTSLNIKVEVIMLQQAWHDNIVQVKISKYHNWKQNSKPTKTSRQQAALAIKLSRFAKGLETWSIQQVSQKMKACQRWNKFQYFCLSKIMLIGEDEPSVVLKPIFQSQWARPMACNYIREEWEKASGQHKQR